MEHISCQNSNMQSFDSNMQSFDSNRPSFDSNMQSFDSNRQTFDSNRQTFNPSIQTFNPSLQSFAPIQTRHPLSSWSFVVSTIIRLFRRSSSLPSFVSFVIRRSLGSSHVSSPASVSGRAVRVCALCCAELHSLAFMSQLFLLKGEHLSNHFQEFWWNISELCNYCCRLLRFCLNFSVASCSRRRI